MSLSVFQVYVIHTSSLSIRMQKLEPIIQLLKSMGQKYGYKVNISLIISPDPESLQGKIEDLQKNVSYEKTDNELFNQCIQILSLEMISNIEKHKESLQKIANNKSNNPKDIHLVIEDDMVLLKDCVPNLEDILKMDHSALDWDMVILGLSKSVDPKDTQRLEKLSELNSDGKILPSKEAYFIRKNVATKILSEFEKYKFTYRIQLSWIINNDPTLKVYYPLKRTTIDGSKLGLFTSSIHSNNILSYNNEYMQLYRFLNAPKEEIQKNMKAIDELYKTVRTLNSPDFTHLYGLLKIKTDALREGETILLEAIDQMKKSQGLLNSRSDLANNLVELYQHLQDDVKN